MEVISQSYTPAATFTEKPCSKVEPFCHCHSFTHLTVSPKKHMKQRTPPGPTTHHESNPCNPSRIDNTTPVAKTTTKTIRKRSPNVLFVIFEWFVISANARLERAADLFGRGDSFQPDTATESPAAALATMLAGPGAGAGKIGR